jgi:hypothetical protein
MNNTLFFVFWIFSFVAFGQDEKFDALLNDAKSKYKVTYGLNQEDLDNFDFSDVANMFIDALKLNPESAEARYFLGYTYSRMNAGDGRGMLGMSLDLLYKTSEQFEKIIAITPKYEGEVIALDPYSKLSSEWGSMAMSYLHEEKVDSAIWAFTEGRTRGGFSEFQLAFNRAVLDACSKDAILISSGDNFAFPLWYLQVVENYRTDVCIVDVSLLGTTWYPRFLAKSHNLQFNEPLEIIDILNYTLWNTQTVSIGDFDWDLRPTFYNQYLLRSDRVLLSMLRANNHLRPVFFTFGICPECNLNLDPFLEYRGLVNKLCVFGSEPMEFSEMLNQFKQNLSVSNYVNNNSQNELAMNDLIRFLMFDRITDFVQNGQKSNARQLLDVFDAYGNEKQVPYFNDALGSDFRALRNQLK